MRTSTISYSLAPPLEGGHARHPVFRLALLVAVLAALAFFVMPGAQPAAAQQEIVFHHIAGLKASQLSSGLGCNNAGTATCDNVSNLTDDEFSYNSADYTITAVVLTGGLLSVNFTQVLPSDLVSALTLRVGAEKTVGGKEVVEFTALAFADGDLGSGNKNISWSNTGMTWAVNENIHLVITSSQDFATLTFGSKTIDDKTFTAGAETPKRSLSLDEVIDLKLPMAMGGGYTHTYTATGLPAGLSMGRDLIIRGTPEAATSEAVEVTYTVTDEANNTASLTFDVSVAPPVEFDAEELADFLGTVTEYTIGQDGGISETLPSASGGHGGLTYHLTYQDDEGVVRTIDADAPGFSFDAATRALTSKTGLDKPSETAFYALEYRAEDANGGRADAYSSLAVRAAPTLSAIADQEFTVGDAESIVLPKAEDGSLRGWVHLEYTVSPMVDGLAFSGGWDRRLSGTPRFPGDTLVTYTVTDANGVSDSQTFTITVVNGPSAPTSAPASVEAGQASSQGTTAVVWGEVTDATEYVVQVIEDGGSYPAQPVNSTPDGARLTFRSAFPTQVLVIAIGSGDYKVRVAAKNDDGVGPWSAEVSFTVKVGGV